MPRLNEKVALVTGSGRGIGRAIAVRLAQEGANVVVNDINENEDSQRTLELIQRAGAEAHFIRADISDVKEVYGLIDQAVAHFGKLDILVNNAGVERKDAFWDIKEDDYELVMGVNLKGAVFASQAFAKYVMKAEHGGKIINISSTHEELPFPYHTTYCLSKGGMKMLTRNLSIELAPYGITINNVAPGAIKTALNEHVLQNPQLLDKIINNISLRRMGEPEDVAGIVAFLASKEADYVTGSTYYVDGGLTWHYEEE